MSDHPSDSELADMGDVKDGPEEYGLAKTDHEPILPREVEEAVKKANAEAEEELQKPPPLQRFQFTIRDMLILTTVVAFLMGLVVSISRGLSVFFIYFIFFLAMIVAWFVVGLWKAGYWRKPEIVEEEERPDAAEIVPAEPDPQPLQYSVLDLFLLVSAFAFLLSLCTLLPGEHKLANAAGITGLCTLVGLLWLAMTESRHPMFILLWWLMFLMYLLTSVAVMVMG